jgi:hypothetical protein
MKKLCVGTAVLGAALVVAPALGYAQAANLENFVDTGKHINPIAPYAMANTGRVMDHLTCCSRSRPQT